MNFLISVVLTVAIFVLFFLLLKLGEWLQSKISFLHDPVYVPSTPQAIFSMLKLAQPKKGQIVVDLGSGDGRLLLAFAKKGCNCIGYEINPILVWKSNQLARKHNVEKRMHFYCKSFWQADISQADIITLFMTASIMERLEKKLLKGVKQGTKVVSQRFRFPHWKIQKQQGDSALYIR